MAEGGDGGIAGVGAPTHGAAFPALPVAPKPRAMMTHRELESLAKRLIRSGNPHLLFDEVSRLTPKEKAYLATTQEFHVLILSMAVDAVVGIDRLTRSQWKAIAWFKTKGPAREGLKKSGDDDEPVEGEIINVETQ